MADDSGRNSPATSEESTQNEDVDYNLVPRCRSKKRVQFHSDENLVRIREIPPRGEQQTTDEDDSGCSEDDDEDDSDEDEEAWPSGDTGKGSSSMPVIVNNAVKLDSVSKGSYDVTKTKGKGSHIVAQITGMSVSNASKFRQKRTGTKDRKAKKSKSLEKTDCTKSKPKSGKKKSQKKTATDTDKSVPLSKKSKEPKNNKPSFQNSNRTSQSRPPGRCLSPLKKIPPKQDQEPSVVSSLPNGFDNHIRSTSVALQNMSVGKVYTMDGFIFPSDPSDQIKAKSVSETGAEVSKSELSKSVLQRKKCFAWHMANGDQQDVLFGTPCILPLWDNVQSYTQVAKSGARFVKRS